MSHKCIKCGKENYSVNTKNFPAIYCSYSCYELFLKFDRTSNTKCIICDREFFITNKRIKKSKTNKYCCSIKCAAINKEKTYRGEKNHQYGLIGHLNSSFKNENIINNYGYILEYCPGHPCPHDKSNKGTRVKQHRLVIERNHQLFDKKYFEDIDGWIVLKKNYDVHHINGIKTDNRLENLQILTRSEHTKLHNKIGVIKLDKLLETPEEDNQQPTTNLNG